MHIVCEEEEEEEENEEDSLEETWSCTARLPPEQCARPARPRAPPGSGAARKGGGRQAPSSDLRGHCLLRDGSVRRVVIIQRHAHDDGARTRTCDRSRLLGFRCIAGDGHDVPREEARRGIDRERRGARCHVLQEPGRHVDLSIEVPARVGFHLAASTEEEAGPLADHLAPAARAHLVVEMGAIRGPVTPQAAGTSAHLEGRVLEGRVLEGWLPLELDLPPIRAAGPRLHYAPSRGVHVRPHLVVIPAGVVPQPRTLLVPEVARPRHDAARLVRALVRLVAVACAPRGVLARMQAGRL
mmetsp:Transcript_48800/g.130246  ORF Transcript_48800/g.130246 Transcript_48800/m.130246 type:complete len:298 (+) Transcript_48800:2-895(+)